MTSLFQQILGHRFDTLAPRVRALHALDGTATWRGEASILRGPHPLARLCSAIVGLPRSGERVATTVVFAMHAHGETWTRDFGGARMMSRYATRGGLLHERLGPVTVIFALDTRQGEIHWRTRCVRLLGLLPLPAWIADVRCRERDHAGRYEFLVEAAMPLIGRLIRYEGWLAPA